MSWNIASSPLCKAVVQSCRQRNAAATVAFDYPTAVTPSVTSPTMALRRNIAHCYTDSVTIMAVVRRRTARRALVTPALARGPQGRAQRSVFL
jgi:hypothetical protein